MRTLPLRTAAASAALCLLLGSSASAEEPSDAPSVVDAPETDASVAATSKRNPWIPLLLDRPGTTLYGVTYQDPHLTQGAGARTGAVLVEARAGKRWGELGLYAGNGWGRLDGESWSAVVLGVDFGLNLLCWAPGDTGANFNISAGFGFETYIGITPVEPDSTALTFYAAITSRFSEQFGMRTQWTERIGGRVLPGVISIGLYYAPDWSI